MAIEAEVLADRHEKETILTDRRGSPDRRGRDRRKPGSRINQHAPMKSPLLRVGLSGFGVMVTVVLITLIYSEVADIALPYVTLAFEASALAVSIIVVALGCLEQRLTEIRLELMMMNGGRRQSEDRRRGSRRGDGAQ
ncbi:hypothetical protein GGQ87_002577 [Brevundimonas alba]|uniref:Uncharacterized protein n=1 Tax=Brevundimonas alba TaxID=74314 RepID=A0A7X5YLV7_9CAUL|nr:hypothetical protein [Brevundimonas alba]NJC42282.1 hypothetical protein [Brevundimonas alba]